MYLKLLTAELANFINSTFKMLIVNFLSFLYAITRHRAKLYFSYATRRYEELFLTRLAGVNHWHVKYHTEIDRQKQ